MGRRKQIDEVDEDYVLENELDDDDLDMESLIGNGRYIGLAGFAIGLAVGAMLGAGAALLSTPVRGETLRRRIKRRVEDLSDDAIEKVDRIREDAGRQVDRTRRRLEKTRKSRR
jgi:YtxH-like protein